MSKLVKVNGRWVDADSVVEIRVVRGGANGFSDHVELTTTHGSFKATCAESEDVRKFQDELAEHINKARTP